MIHQYNLTISKWWICFEWSPRIKPVYGKGKDFIYFYWLIGGLQIGNEI